MPQYSGMRETRKDLMNIGGLTFLVIYLFSRCNKHLLDLGKIVKKSIASTKAIIPYQFGTVGVSDGISMGTFGMSYSLQSRDLIADQVESTAGGHWLDGMVVIPGCDKNMPGVLMACRSIVVLFKWVPSKC